MKNKLSKFNQNILDICFENSNIIKFIRHQILDRNLESEFISTLKQDLRIIEESSLVISKKEYTQMSFDINFFENYNIKNKFVRDLLIENFSTFEFYQFKRSNDNRYKFLWYKDQTPMLVSSFAYILVNSIIYTRKTLDVDISKYKSLYQINEGIEQAIFDFKPNMKEIIEYLQNY